MKPQDGNGGWAYPAKWYSDPNIAHEHNGMTLLDYFAGQALPALIGQLANTEQADERMRSERLGDGEFDRLCAICAYDYAEAMIQERNKRNRQI